MASKALDGVLIKKAHTQQTFTEKQIIELQQCADPDDGYLYFLTHFYYIQHPTKGQLLYEPYEYQLRLLESYHKYRQSISLLPRQSGKTTTAAGYLLWYAMFHADQTLLVAAHKGKGALEIMQRIRYGYELCPNHIRCGVTGYNKGSIDFDNNSRIISDTTTADTGRGKSISLLYCLDGDTTYVTVRNKLTLVEEHVTLKDLYEKLLNVQSVIT